MRQFLANVWCYLFHGPYYKITVLADETYSIACEKCGKDWEV